MDGTDAETPLLAVAFGSEAGRALGWRYRGAALQECGGLWVSRLLGGSLTWGLQCAWQLGSVGQCVMCVTVPRVWDQKYPSLPGVVLKHVES